MNVNEYIMLIMQIRNIAQGCQDGNQAKFSPFPI